MDLNGLERTGMDPVSAHFQHTNLGGTQPLRINERIQISTPRSNRQFLVDLLSGLNLLILSSVSVFFGFLGIISPYDPKI